MSAKALPAPSLFGSIVVRGKSGGRVVRWLSQILARIPRHPGSLFYLTAICGGKVLVYDRSYRASSYVAPFGTPCSTSAERTGVAVIRYVDFYRRVQQLCSATVSNWRRNTAHELARSNLVT